MYMCISHSCMYVDVCVHVHVHENTDVPGTNKHPFPNQRSTHNLAKIYHDLLVFTHAHS